MPEQTEDSYQTAPILIGVCTVYYGVCLFPRHFATARPTCFRFRIITAIFWLSKNLKFYIT